MARIVGIDQYIFKVHLQIGDVLRTVHNDPGIAIHFHQFLDMAGS